MATYADKISLRELIELVRRNDIDVPEMQRTFVEKPSWVVRLVDSLYHDIPIGQVLIWLPDTEHRPTAGRYQRHSACSRWILDGQQRITALLAAMGMRPPWIPDDRWSRMVRDPLQVAVGARRDGQLTFRALHPAVAGEVPLGDLLTAGQVTDVLGPDDVLSADIIQKYCALREKLLNSEIALAYLPGDYRTAALGFARRNQKSSATTLRREELSLCLLGAIHPPLQREHIDPLLQQAQQQNLGRVVDRRRVSRVLEDLLPGFSPIRRPHRVLSPRSSAAANGRKVPRPTTPTCIARGSPRPCANHASVRPSTNSHRQLARSRPPRAGSPTASPHAPAGPRRFGTSTPRTVLATR